MPLTARVYVPTSIPTQHTAPLGAFDDLLAHRSSRRVTPNTLTFPTPVCVPASMIDVLTMGPHTRHAGGGSSRARWVAGRPTSPLAAAPAGSALASSHVSLPLLFPPLTHKHIRGSAHTVRATLRGARARYTDRRRWTTRLPFTGRRGGRGRGRRLLVARAVARRISTTSILVAVPLSPHERGRLGWPLHCGRGVRRQLMVLGRVGSIDAPHTGGAWLLRHRQQQQWRPLALRCAVTQYFSDATTA